MNKIGTLIVFFVFQLTIFAQTDLTSSNIENGDFENGIHKGWELELKGGAVASYADAGKTAAAYGGHAAKVELISKQFMHHVILKNSIPAGDHPEKH